MSQRQLFSLCIVACSSRLRSLAVVAVASMADSGDDSSDWTESEYEVESVPEPKKEAAIVDTRTITEKNPLYKDVKVCQCVDHYVTGLGMYNTCSARNATKELTNATLWSLKYSWEDWEQRNTHTKKFDSTFHVLKFTAACCGTFMVDYFAVPRRYHLRFDDQFNWSTVPALVDFLVANRQRLVDVAEGAMSVHTFKLCNAIVEEAGWHTIKSSTMETLKKQSEALYWLLVWARGSTFRKFAIERGKVIQSERLKRFASKVSVMFVSKIMRENTPLYHVSEKSWLTVVDAKEDTSSEEEFSDEESNEHE